MFASASMDKTVRVWDTRERSKPMITVQVSGGRPSMQSWVQAHWVTCNLRAFMRSDLYLAPQAHDADVNVLSWNRVVGYMMASGSDDGSLKIWDLRSFTTVRPVRGKTWGPAKVWVHIGSLLMCDAHLDAALNVML